MRAIPRFRQLETVLLACHVRDHYFTPTNAHGNRGHGPLLQMYARAFAGARSYRCSSVLGN